ncbi:hypothetical protein ACQPZF_14605 [Actinosynnema sp. CS-041913]|uniref:hypothetical protein n=1 Tax=Actinosynnema sp. CS-041913 TaxID=3239917 RepID=UPI003D9247DD
MSSTPIYDELAATYLADVDLGGPAPEAASQALGPGGQTTPAEPQPHEHTQA